MLVEVHAENAPCPNQIRASRPAGVVHDIEVAVGTEFEPH